MEASGCTHYHSTQHPRFVNEEGWRLLDMSFDRFKYVAVSAYNRNTHETAIDVFSFFSSHSRNEPKLLYSIQFEKYVSKGLIYRGRLVCFGPGNGEVVTCLCNKIEIIRKSKTNSREYKVNDNASCMFVKQREIYIGFYKSRQVIVYDYQNFHEITCINLVGIEKGFFPFDIIAVDGQLFTCVGEDSPSRYSKSLVIEKDKGNNLLEFTHWRESYWHANSTAVNLQLGLVVVVWYSSYYIHKGTNFQIVFYALTNKTYSRFLIVEDDPISKIRLSDEGDRLLVGNQLTGELKMYDMAEIFTYSHLKNYIWSQLEGDDCKKLSGFFDLPKDQAEAILRSETPVNHLFLALEERGIVCSSNVERLMTAFLALRINSSCYAVAEIYQKTRLQVTMYSKLLATLSAHLPKCTCEDLFHFFDLSDVEKDKIMNSHNSGLSLLLTLNEMGHIGPSKVEDLAQIFSRQRLVQAEAKVQEYTSVLTEITNQSRQKSELLDEDKLSLFICRLKKKIKSWYETMTPVPWKISCKWKSVELFVGSGLILTDSQTKENVLSIDEKCKLKYSEIFSNERLKSERRIILEGGSGSGKTMLMSQLAYDWAVGRFSDIGMVILLPLRFVGGRTLVQAIAHFYLQDENRLTHKDVESFIKNSTDSIHLLLDGLEEFSDSGPSEGQSDIMEIILKKKYPGCNAVVTTRSEFVTNLPKQPLLKLSPFGEKERNMYIEKVFPDDTDRQKTVKKIIMDSPFMISLCSTPVLFVMVLHNLEELGTTDQFHSVSPFIQRILEILCLSWTSTQKGKQYSKDKLIEVKADHERPTTNVDSQSVFLDTQHKNFVTLEELAFNGLCRGFQQLSWQKGFLERHVVDSNQWIESGVLVTEEGYISLSNLDHNELKREGLVTESESDIKEMRFSKTSQKEENFFPAKKDKSLSKNTKDDKHLRMQRTLSLKEGKEHFSNVETESNSESGDDSDLSAESSIYSPSKIEKNLSTGSTSEKSKNKDIQSKTQAALTQVHCRFLHKLIQEWFAAKHLSSLLWRSVATNRLQQCLKEHLKYIPPSDLHFILRFTCFLCPPSYRHMVKYFFNNYRFKGNVIPGHIMDCIFLCYAEYNGYGDQRNDIIEIVEEICKNTIIISSDDSALLKKAKTSVLKIASENLVSIRKVVLSDVVVAATEEALTLNSGVYIEALNSLKEIEVNRWDQTLQDEDRFSILKFISKCHELQMAQLHLPYPPPELDEANMESLQMDKKNITWRLGSGLNQQLNTKTGKWKMIPNTAEGVTKDGDRSRGVDVKVGDHGITNSLRTEKVIGKQGGTLFLREADISMHVPENALGGSRLISIIVPLDPSDYEPCPDIFPRFTPLTICKPEDIHFKVPVRLTLPHCAVIKSPKKHNVEVKFGRNTEIFSKEMMWTSEKVDYSLGEHYCSIYLYHFSGVDVAINAAEEKILRVIPYTKLGHGNKQVMSVWLCNDLESDFQSIIQTEEANEGIPLDSYDTFRLRCIPGQEETNVAFNLETCEGSNWIPEENQDVIDVNRLSSGTKSKCNFRLNGGGQDADCYVYLFLRVFQLVGDVRTETTFAIRKRICDLQTPVKFKKPCSLNGQQAEHVFTKENLPRICTAVVYMDPVRNVNDDAIITLWLSPFDSTTAMFKLLQQEQELQLKHRVDTENSFSIFDENIAVVTKTTFRNGQWRLSPEEKKIETDRIRYGSRVKFQFIGKRKENDDSTYIDLQVETFQEGKNKIKFMTDVEIIRLLYEMRLKNTDELGIFVKSEVNNDSEEEKASLRFNPVAANKGEHTAQATAASAPPSQRNEHPGSFEEPWFKKHFLLLKDSLADGWKNLGRHLGLPDDELNRISIEQKDDVREAVYKMLLCWQQRKGSDATCETLLQKLREIGRRDLAEKLESL